ncbi:D-alanyl-D-alanine carboxypeptidase [Defluviimonas sp. WL0024]|uniref:serine-type D-Ala-D-Ala carboxypeptidase n=2 Tax=Albidovulum TaxID=205889 RepID=A0ABT3J760_9RHOB|nr:MULTISPECIES: D-alanyl-D-alanine carboxypeptidase family protein [Defluviimonas]MCU9847307.1 D-alanyl-D-alanine carboxypeptidase [Defluviimonas sp. WL0024]MCW3783528.1 D-alanyl-D-alanine carboxypeptidase [Defluviimonas salinarum]
MAALPARAFETLAGAAWVYDITTGTVLLEKNADEPLPPASMSKLMTLNMLFEALKDGRAKMDTTFSVSTKAWKMGGSKMFVKPDDRPTIEELIHGIIINSGNDACVVVAEGLAGSESNFASLMTKRAQDLGMTQSHFANASGWPDPNHKMSARDLGFIATRLITEFPEFYPYFAMTDYNYKDRVPANSRNRNPMLRTSGSGDWTADGLKTGHTSEAGYGLVGSAVHENGRRIVFVLTGMASEAERAQEAEAITNWAFREFVQKTVAAKGTRIADADVWLGASARVGLVVGEDLQLLLPSLAQDKLSASVVYTGPIEAPVEAGQKLADMVIEVPGIPPMTVPLVAENAVAKGGFTSRIKTAFGILAKRVMAEIGS